MSQRIDPIVSYKVWYRPNPEYNGTFQMDKIGNGGLHAHVGPAMAVPGGSTLDRAIQESKVAKSFFNEEKVAVESSDSQGRKKTVIKTNYHDNVIVWVETFKDGFPIKDGEIACVEGKPQPKEEKDQAQRIAELELKLQEMRSMFLKSQERELQTA